MRAMIILPTLGKSVTKTASMSPDQVQSRRTKTALTRDSQRPNDALNGHFVSAHSRTTLCDTLGRKNVKKRIHLGHSQPGGNDPVHPVIPYSCYRKGTRLSPDSAGRDSTDSTAAALFLSLTTVHL